ncbi:hypothetical protein LEP1GSC038_4434 [Leptospira weilii str. 2006001855]|uniref:Uncharacterized protein n=1 Tax=Leptospira weilii str. 2006001855 TaxID=996804 RepID=M6FQ76_9LEPT|nr:hypothetical protein LEP1GSC038_4434 [Leptospira weilii str. 2006001855]
MKRPEIKIEDVAFMIPKVGSWSEFEENIPGDRTRTRKQMTALKF